MTGRTGITLENSGKFSEKSWSQVGFNQLFHTRTFFLFSFFSLFFLFFISLSVSRSNVVEIDERDRSGEACSLR